MRGDAGIADIAQVIERASGRVPAAEPTPDLPIEVLVGAVHRLLAEDS
jgi:hypothetical protein